MFKMAIKKIPLCQKIMDQNTTKIDLASSIDYTLTVCQLSCFDKEYTGGILCHIGVLYCIVILAYAHVGDLPPYHVVLIID